MADSPHHLRKLRIDLGGIAFKVTELISAEALPKREPDSGDDRGFQGKTPQFI
jgi:hypothetical protein